MTEIAELSADEMVLNMGPQHPSTHGVLRLELRTDGEIVNSVRPHIGYLHRCFEKHGETLPYPQMIPFTDRLDYVASMNNNLGFCLAVEKMLTVQIPPRAEHCRVLAAELNRIASHLLAFGTYGIDIGAITPFLYAFREREMILNFFERMCGARLTYNYVRVGGVMRDLPEGIVPEILKFLDYFEPMIDTYNELLNYNKIFVERTAHVGVLDADTAVAWGVTGPALRAAGVKWDLRKDEPYSLYEKLDFEVPVGNSGGPGVPGDCWSRHMVRIREMRESAKLCRQVLEKMPGGDFWGKVPKALKLPPGEVYVRTENPRGELGFHIVSRGGKEPWRLKCRAPSFHNIAALQVMAPGCLIADIIAMVGSLDIVLGEVDR